jgi:hypothetical protein
MATPVTSQSELYEVIDGMVHQKFAQVNDRQVLVNRAVKKVLSDMDLRSAKRKSTLSPNLFSDVYDYTAPSDLKGEKIIDLRKQVNRPTFEKWSLIDESEFDRKKTAYKVAIRDENFSKLLRVSGGSSKSKVLHDCESLTSNGTWAASADASNLTLDNDNYISGGGALNFDMAVGAATGVITNTGMTAVDLTDYDEKGSVFVWVYIPDYSDAEGDTVTNFILRWGNDSSNYWHKTVTTNNEGVTFYDGWQLLRFDWNGATEVGTVNPATIDYLVLTVTKSTSLAADTDWRVDSFIARIGDIYDIVYYSKYGWQSSAGAYIEESTATTDLVLGDTDEIEGISLKCAEYASQELKDYDDVKMFKEEYENWKRNYQGNNPSEALKKSRNYSSLPNLNNRY